MQAIFQIIDFHNHHVPARFELTAAQAAPPNQRARWDAIARRVSDEDLLLKDIREGEISARVINIPAALIADAEGRVPHDTVLAMNDDLAALVARYPVREVAGLLFAYMGPAPVPEFPVWEPFTWNNGFREIVLADVPCNWFQCQENSCDPVHFEWMHDNWSNRLQGSASNTAPKHLKLKFEEFEYGLIYRRVREGQPEDSRYWTVGRVALWPNAFYLGSHFEWRVPVDDENTLSVAWFFMRVPKGREPYVQQQVPTWVSPIKDASGRWISSHVINQDIVAWVGQGRIADRSKENLRSSDIGITMMRQRFFADMEAVADGRDPMGVIRDPVVARTVPLPNIMTDINTSGLSLQEIREHPLLRQRLKGFRFHFGQPPEVRRAFEDAMGTSAN
jgi:5,5'-dehydrodivanillate O-demethylase